MGERYNKSETIGKRIKEYRKKKDLTAEQLGKEIGGISRQLVDKWEHDLRDPMPYIDKICSVLDVEKNRLLYGIDSNNISVYADLGLCNQAIEQLRKLNSFPQKKYVAEIYIDETSTGEVEPEGFSPEENLQMINYLITTTSGAKLLSYLYRYCFSDFTNAYLDEEEFSNSNPVYDLTFKNRSEPTGKTIITTSLMRYAVLKGIEHAIEELAYNVKGDE